MIPASCSAVIRASSQPNSCNTSSAGLPPELLGI